MSFFSNLFKKRRTEETITRDIFVDDTDPNENSTNTVSSLYNTNFPIDAIYAFVRKNMEDEGYNDALCCSDNYYKEKKIKIIKKELKTLFNQINLKYSDEIKRLDHKIIIAQELYLNGNVVRYNNQKKIMQDHIEQLKKLESDFDNNENIMTGMLDSYEMGFSRGVASQINEITQWNIN